MRLARFLPAWGPRFGLDVSLDRAIAELRKGGNDSREAADALERGVAPETVLAFLKERDALRADSQAAPIPTGDLVAS